MAGALHIRRRVIFGFSDRVRVYLKGRMLYLGLAFAVSENFGGWAIIAAAMPPLSERRHGRRTPHHTKIRISFNSRSRSRSSAAFSKSRFLAASFISFVSRAMVLSRSSSPARSSFVFFGRVTPKST